MSATATATHENNTTKSNADIIEENREHLELLAQSDLSCSWVAQELLDSIGGHSSYSTKQPEKTEPETTETPQNPTETERSIFDY